MKNKYKDLTELQRKMVAILLKVNGKDREAAYIELCRKENKKKPAPPFECNFEIKKDDDIGKQPATVEMTQGCKCRFWARDNILLLTSHHPKCPKYNVEKEARAHIEALLSGIIIWANDEDGVHDQCFDAFRSAAYFIGKPDLVKEEKHYERKSGL